MDDKKQIEEMEELLNEYCENIDDSFASADIAMEIIDRVFYFVKRVQELEQELHFCKVTKLSMDSVEKYTSQLKKQNKRYREALEFIDEELELVLHSNRGLAEKMFYIENSKRKITEVLESESE